MNIFLFCFKQKAFPHGTLLSVFYHNDKWYISTRRCLNSQDSVWGSEKKSHYQMFMEVLHESGYETFEDFGKKLDIKVIF